MCLTHVREVWLISFDRKLSFYLFPKINFFGVIKILEERGGEEGFLGFGR